MRLNAVGFAALVLLVYRPAWLFEAGFQLSFSAALLIAGLAVPILERTTSALPQSADAAWIMLSAIRTFPPRSGAVSAGPSSPDRMVQEPACLSRPASSARRAGGYHSRSRGLMDSGSDVVFRYYPGRAVYAHGGDLSSDHPGGNWVKCLGLASDDGAARAGGAHGAAERAGAGVGGFSRENAVLGHERPAGRDRVSPHSILALLPHSRAACYGSPSVLPVL